MAWVDPDTYGWIYHPQDDADWNALIRDCGGGPRFATVVDVARTSGCQTVVVENRYVDADYRSDYSAFWSKRFDSVSPFARRAHFFRAHLQEDVLHSPPADLGYLGYSVLRPGPHADGHVGRTLLVPPPSLQRATIATAKDEISFFGTTLTVEGAPFCEQDGEFLRCRNLSSRLRRDATEFSEQPPLCRAC